MFNPRTRRVKLDLMLRAHSNSFGFGGVGQIGMGRYSGGKVDYTAFSNPKAVHRQGLMRRFTGIFFPPLKSERARRILRSQVGVKE